MKKWMFLLITVFLNIANASEREVGNGGDAIVSEFRTLATELAKEISNNKAITEVKAADFIRKVKESEVVSLEKVHLEKKELDAVNYPNKNLIILSRMRWLDYKGMDSFHKRARLVIHEYLGLLKVDDANYERSESILKKLKSSDNELAITLDKRMPKSFLVSLDQLATNANTKLIFSANKREKKLEILAGYADGALPYAIQYNFTRNWALHLNGRHDGNVFYKSDNWNDNEYYRGPNIRAGAIFTPIILRFFSREVIELGAFAGVVAYDGRYMRAEPQLGPVLSINLSPDITIRGMGFHSLKPYKRFSRVPNFDTVYMALLAWRIF